MINCIDTEIRPLTNPSTSQILLFEDAQRIKEREEKEASGEKMVVESLDDHRGKIDLRLVHIAEKILSSGDRYFASE